MGGSYCDDAVCSAKKRGRDGALVQSLPEDAPHAHDAITAANDW